MSPDSERQDDVTVQVPTTEPPQGVRPGQFGAEPPVPVDPLDPPVPVVLLQPPSAIPAARASELTNPTKPIRIRMGLPSVLSLGGNFVYDCLSFFVAGVSCFDRSCRLNGRVADGLAARE
jgi:hypothetical protein